MAPVHGEEVLAGVAVLRLEGPPGGGIDAENGALSIQKDQALPHTGGDLPELVALAAELRELAVDLLAEMLARRQKAPAIIYALIGVVPLVPGAGLYRTMLALVLKDYASAAAIGVETVLISGCIALAIAIVTLFARHASVKRAQRLVK